MGHSCYTFSAWAAFLRCLRRLQESNGKPMFKPNIFYNYYGAILCVFWRSWRKPQKFEDTQANKTEPKKTKYPSNKPNSVRGEKPMQGIQATLATEAMTDQTGSNGMSPDQVLIPGPLKQNLQDRQRRISRGCYKILLQEVPDGIPEELSYKHWYRQRTFKIFKILILPQGPLRGLKIKIFTPGTLRI